MRLRATDNRTLARVVTAALACLAASAAAAESTYGSRGVAALFANDHGGEVHDCPAWVVEIFPGPAPPACLTLQEENLAVVRALLERTVEEIRGIDWAGPWTAGDGGDPRQMVHREIDVDGSRFVLTLRLAGPSASAREVLMLVQARPR